MSVGDFVQKNKYYQGFWRPEVIQEVINIGRKEGEERKERAIKSKEEQEDQERKRKYFFMHKWNLIKSKKKEMLQYKLEEKERRARLRTFMLLLEISKISKLLWTSFEDRKYLQLVYNVRVLSATRVKRTIRKQIMRHGATY